MLFLWVPYLLMARSPRRWWLYTGLLVLPFAVGSRRSIEPIWIDPLFNEFGPMKDRRSRPRSSPWPRRAGIDGGRVFEVDKSRDTKTVNAYVTGLFGTKRIVLWDTLLDQARRRRDPGRHGPRDGPLRAQPRGPGRVLLASLGSLVAPVPRPTAPADAMVRRFGRRFGFDRLSDVASVPL